MLKPTLCSLLLLVLCAFNLSAQSSSDSLPIKDSALQEIKDAIVDDIPVISLDENDLNDAGNQNISSLLSAGRDPFLNAATFNFSIARFRLRGYDADMNGMYINNLPVDNLDNGFTPWGLWSGLNDVFRTRDINAGISTNTFSFGDIGTTTNIDTRAAKQRKQTSVGYAWSNRTYTHRLTVTHNTGLNKKGWALSFSGSRRYSDEGYVPGTYYNAWSYFLGVDKKLGSKQMLSLVAFGTPTESARQGASVEEMQQLAGTHYYNPYWGYQNRKKRNASVSKTHQPYAILTHDYHITNKTSLVTSLGYSTGNRITTGLDWYNAPDPRPDYYRYLPSYYKDDSTQYNQVKDFLQNNETARQINWQHLYDVNRASNETVVNANGITGNNVSGKLSHYIIEDRVTATQRINFNTAINAGIGEHLQLAGGISYQMQINHYYKKVNDLLGGDFYINLNQFAEDDFPNDNNAIQNDLNHPNGVIYKNQKFGYDYTMHLSKAEEWAQLIFHFPRFDFFVAGDVSYTSFYRVGNMRNGLYPENSFGKSALNQFFNYGVKGGITYKLDGRNYLFINAERLTKAPYFDNVYISPRTRDFVQDNITNETIQTIEGGYVLNAPKYRVRLKGYYTKFNNGMNVLTFYHDDYRSFVNYALSNIDKLHYGGELGIEITPIKNVSINAAASVGRYYYNSRQQASVTADNTTELLDKATIYTQNYRVPSTSQEACSFGITYRSPKAWFASISANYFNEMWLDFNPIRRTTNAVEGLDSKSNLYHEIIDQAKLPAQYTVDFFAGYNWRLPRQLRLTRNSSLVFNAGINNLADNKNMVAFGYEQLRFNSTEKDVSKFPPKYSYALGRTYFISATLRF